MESVYSSEFEGRVLREVNTAQKREDFNRVEELLIKIQNRMSPNYANLLYLRGSNIWKMAVNLYVD